MPADNTCPASPPGYLYRGGCELLCRPATWSDILVFYLGNYVAHVVTVLLRPGQALAANILYPVTALIFPGTGVSRAIHAIASIAVFAPTELQMAARAGALYTVAPVEDVDNDEERDGDGGPRDQARGADVEAGPGGSGSAGEEQKGPHQANRNTIEEPIKIPRLLSPTVHGAFRLPKGYCFIPLDRRAQFVNDPEDIPAPISKRVMDYFTAAFRPRRTDRAVVACDYNVVKIIAALVQLAFGAATLYRTRGDQIDVFGYAAFGLTVAQYTWMSLLNLLGSLVCPNYPSAYVVESQTLRDLRTRISGAQMTDQFPLTGTVGELTREYEEQILERYSDNIKRGGDPVSTYWIVDSGVAAPWVGSVPLAIIGGLSRFHSGNSALYQRVWTMAWFVFGTFMGPLVTLMLDAALEGATNANLDSMSITGGFLVGYIGIFCFFAGPAIGGFVVVGQMIIEYGSCVRLN